MHWKCCFIVWVLCWCSTTSFLVSNSSTDPQYQQLSQQQHELEQLVNQMKYVLLATKDRLEVLENSQTGLPTMEKYNDTDMRNELESLKKHYTVLQSENQNLKQGLSELQLNFTDTKLKNNEFESLKKQLTVLQLENQNLKTSLKDLQHNFTDTKTKLEHLNNVSVENQNLKINFSILQHQSISLERNFADLKHELNQTKKYLGHFETDMRNEMRQTKNSSQMCNSKCSNVLHLLNTLDTKTGNQFMNLTGRIINAENNFSFINSKLNQIEQQSASLNIKVAGNDQKLTALESRMHSQIQQINQNYSTSVIAIDHAIDNLERKTDSGITNLTGRTVTLEQNLGTIDNKVTHALQSVTSSTEKVGFTACANTRTVNVGLGIPFDDIKESHGIHNLDQLKTRGEFVCEKPGLYLISAHISSQNPGADFSIKTNKMDVTRVQVVPLAPPTNTQGNLHTGSGLVIVELDNSDYVWIEPYSKNMKVWYFFSCLSIVKLK
ncbi:early endosome antigen 1-like [Mytilus trossulus]|uniref:early endosome antigen 1-like n=1 Tax=Mytilus trossulus TaxID=6551 RepID=UPI0030075AD6